ncbi:cocaine- and amphetamine-regulated transcript protein-like [Myxocyprinus asiaticus]|uniref:cocaine- and amphetamine-regulated transcript protein-like n=1 Tax=Myxocyprinus asiaticus TaxID=70543 RepID=UPI0022239FFC|nr:cocaine- and amphetamine-regulated transcript protein-like [Myxocyprinus asiaticus]
MESSGILIGLIIVGLFTIMCCVQVSQELSSNETQLSQQKAGKNLNILLFFKGCCAVGSRCAMRLGPRIGKLCDCGRGSNCH